MRRRFSSNNPDWRVEGALKNPFVSSSLVISQDHESLIKTRYSAGLVIEQPMQIVAQCRIANK
jgi:hypothetical protein